MATLEQGEAALAFSSGMAAVSAVLTALTKTGDHILCSQGVYGCTFGLLQLLKGKYNIEHDFSAMTSCEMVEKDLRPNTSCIYIETPINPTMKLVDLELVAMLAKKRVYLLLWIIHFVLLIYKLPSPMAVILLFIAQQNIYVDTVMSLPASWSVKVTLSKGSKNYTKGYRRYYISI